MFFLNLSHIKPCFKGVWLFIIIVLFGCTQNIPSSEDVSRFESVEKKYKDDFKFELMDELYINVYQKREGADQNNKLYDVYKDFFLNGNDFRESSKFIYLNYYNPDGRFIHQLYYDRRSKRVVTSKVEHY